jgi:hypothetical protein
MRSVSLHAALPLLASFAVMGGCASSTNENVREEVARTEATVQQVQQSGMTQQAGGLELEEAKDKAQQARAALEDGKDEKALRLAEQARLDADLAQAKARSNSAQRSAEEVRTSIEQLRREALRQSSESATTPSTTTSPGATTSPGTTTMPAPTSPATEPRM